MRMVYRLLGLVATHGPGPVDAACAKALELDVVDITTIARMLEQATETAPVPAAPGKVLGSPARFARDATEYQVGSR